MNVPNALTLSRFGFAAALMALLAADFAFSKTLALAMFVVAALTDWLDGHLARNVHGVTNFGKLMDPLADKVIVSAALIGLVELRLHETGPPLVPAFIVVIIIAREFMVTGLRLLAAGEGQVLSAGRWGKHKAAWQMIAIIALLAGLALRADILPEDLAWRGEFDLWFQRAAWALMAWVSLLTVVSGAIYFRQQRDLILDAA